jgi:hypothetical protein
MFPTGRLAQGLARFLDMEEVTGSIPVSPTIKTVVYQRFFCGRGPHAPTRAPKLKNPT